MPRHDMKCEGWDGMWNCVRQRARETMYDARRKTIGNAKALLIVWVNGNVYVKRQGFSMLDELCLVA